MDGGLHVALQQRLVVGVAKDEVDTLNAFLHHVVDGIASATAHADDLDIVGLLHTDGLEQLVAFVMRCIIFCHGIVFLGYSMLSGVKNSVSEVTIFFRSRPFFLGFFWLDSSISSLASSNSVSAATTT